MHSSLRFHPLPLWVRLALAAGASCTLGTSAQAADPQALTLDEMVVTASDEQSIEDAPASITVIDGETLAQIIGTWATPCVTLKV